jgi:uncharacterized OB-fold protein
VIVPAETELTAPYWAAARRGEVLLQKCERCARVWHPPAPLCPGCRGSSWSWLPAAGTATLVSWTRVVHPVHAQVADSTPYAVGLVQLAEGPLFVCGLDTPDDDGLVDGALITIGLGIAAGGARLPLGRPVAPAAPGEAARARRA